MANAATGKPYRGVNTVVLWTTAQAEGYPSAVWATYRQWAELGAQVRKVEGASPVVFWKISDKEEQEDVGEGEEDGRRPGRTLLRQVMPRYPATYRNGQPIGWPRTRASPSPKPGSMA